MDMDDGASESTFVNLPCDVNTLPLILQNIKQNKNS